MQIKQFAFNPRYKAYNAIHRSIAIDQDQIYSYSTFASNLMATTVIDPSTSHGRISYRAHEQVDDFLSL